MKLSFGFYITVIVLALVIALTMCNSCSSYMPYAGPSRGSAIEGFRQPRTQMEYSTYPDNVTIDKMNSKSINQVPVESTCTKVFGFSGLQCSPTFNDNNLDMYSNAQGDSKCMFESSGLSNSRGPLCLDAAMKTALQTRGGNQTGAPFAIGK